MYRDQFGEFVCGYWGLKGYWLITNHLDDPHPVALLAHDDDNDDNYDAVHGSVFSKKTNPIEIFSSVDYFVPLINDILLLVVFINRYIMHPCTN